MSFFIVTAIVKKTQWSDTKKQLPHCSRWCDRSEFAALVFTFLLCSVTRSFKHLPVGLINVYTQARCISYTTCTYLTLPLCFFEQHVFFLWNEAKRDRWKSFRNTRSTPKPRAISFRLCGIMWNTGMTTLRSVKRSLCRVILFSDRRLMTSCSKPGRTPMSRKAFCRVLVSFDMTKKGYNTGNRSKHCII